MFVLPDISVIITCFNYGKYLERCLRSIYNQELTDRYKYEVIVVDDASKDNTGHLCNRFISIYPNLIYIRNDINKGLPQSCNIGLSKSLGRYIVRVDADDYVARHFLFMLKYTLDKNKNIQAICCDYTEVDDTERYIDYVDVTKNEIACGIMYRKNILDEIGWYNEEFEYREGHELNKRFKQNYVMGHLPMPLYCVRKHDKNRSKNISSIKKFDKKLKS